MDLNKQTIRYYEMVLGGDIAKEESADIIVPDMYPDILRIVDAAGLTVVREKNAREGSADLTGVVKVSVLYLPEGETGLRRVEVSLPYNHILEHPAITAETVVVARATLLTCEARTVNPRKINVTVTLNLDMKLYGPADWEVCRDVPETASGNIEVQKTLQTAFMPVAVANSVFMASEEMEVPPSKPGIVDLLRADVRLTSGDAKPIGNKLVVKGLAAIRLTYTTAKTGEPGEELAFCDLEMPLSHIMEIENIEEGCVCDVDLALCGLDIDLRAAMGGESRAVSVSAQIEAQVRATQDKRIEALTDLYSTSYDVTPQFLTVEISRLLEKSVRRHTVRDSFEMGASVSTVLDMRVALWPVSVVPGALSTDAQVTVLYVAEDGGIYSAARRLTINMPLEVAEGARITAGATLAGEATAAMAHDGLDVRFGIDFDVMVTQIQKFAMVSGVTADLTTGKDHGAHHSVVLRRSRLGESLWNIAKTHNTTMKQIAEANHLDADEEVPEGKMLLIPYMH